MLLKVVFVNLNRRVMDKRSISLILIFLGITTLFVIVADAKTNIAK